MEWPKAIHDCLLRQIGAPLETERLGGMSGAGVWLARGPAGALVAKRTSPREAAFYRSTAPGLRAGGVPVVACHGVWDEPGECWLALEAVPRPLPETRRLADPGVTGALRRLHALTWDQPPAEPGQYVPVWSDATTAGALRAFADDRLETLLLRAQHAAQPLLAPRCAISGDPNPANWGVRADDILALFDWERYGAGTPPLDLAITIPGLGDPAAFTRVAECYLSDAPGPLATHWGSASLSREIALAKIWSVVEFAAGHRAGGATDAVMTWLRTAVATWLPETVAFALPAHDPGGGIAR
jgi:hypothetical protein